MMITVEILDAKTRVTMMELRTNLSREVVMAAYTRWKDGMQELMEFPEFLKSIYPTATIFDVRDIRDRIVLLA